MEEVVDRIIAEIKAMIALPKTSDGIADVIEIKDVYFGDPGVIPQSLMPAIIVEPKSEVPTAETTGYDRRSINVDIMLMIDARQYFEVDSSEAIGDRILVQSAELIARWFRMKDKRQLDGLVIDTVVLDTTYDVEPRGNAIVKTGRVSLMISKGFAR
jgi:hypothetical protein